ncbi:helix-turn-helix domain-containing protein [Streptomyces katsurahamanus]|uniref:Helix-turn-helix transcriptional regulator n=1 Tax=Streptomyces katsurahamanus TaxID=2577098 RepID=A0ABW9NY31_9ACTN|nr:helix-turn-helix transcriptional regulator [Streptomyces katsurahamanus]MQS38213.1 helix-turn-helix transcriptional regulator [Streptomyces katsurahamanus]
MNRKDLNPDAGPVAAYGARLRSSREARNWTQEHLADLMGYSSQHISAMETGRKPPTLRSSLSADAVFGLAGTIESFERAWREIKHGSLLEGFPEYVGHEARAEEIRLFETGLIPGLLQTRAYAAALEAGNVRRGSITAEQAAERVEFLIERQAALVRDLPPLVIVVLDESCIRKPIGGPRVMDEQLGRLSEFAQQPSTSLQIAPFAMGELIPFSRSVNLLTLTDRSVIAYVESQTQGYLDREITSVLPLVRAYHQLQTEAPSQAESVAMISQVRKGTP